MLNRAGVENMRKRVGGWPKNLSVGFVIEAN